MTKEEFYINLCKLAKLPMISKDCLARPMVVTVSHANYGEPSAVIIELQGSGPHMTTMARVNVRGYDVVVNSKAISSKKSPNRVYKIQELIEVFLRSSGYMTKKPRLFSDSIPSNEVFSAEKAPNEVKTERESHSLAYLMEKHDIELDVFEFHDSLENAGIIELKTNDEGFEYYSITAAGLGFGRNVIVPSANSNDIKEQPSWYDDTFLELRAIASNY